MLVLSRKVGEKVMIGGDIVVRIVRIDRDTVKIGIEAPPDIPVHRQEIFDAIKSSQKKPVSELVRLTA